MTDINEFKKRHARKRRNRKLKNTLTYLLIIVALILFFSVIRYGIKIISSAISSNFTRNLIANDVIYPEPPEAEADLLVAIKKPDGVKTCYLTFDDGPTKSVTPRVLDTLRRYNVKATFFMVGSLIEANPDMARRVYDEGHFLANHSYSHDYSDIYESRDSIMNEFNKTDDIIKNITGEKNYEKVFRFPGGGHNSGYYGEVKQDYKTLLKENQIRYCDWNALNGDAEGGSPSAEELVARVKKSTSGKEDVVILMHDAAAKSTTADAMPQIIEYLISQGYEFKTLDKAPRV